MRTPMIALLTLVSLTGCVAGSDSAASTGGTVGAESTASAGGEFTCTEGVAYRYRTEGLGGELIGLDDGKGAISTSTATVIESGETVTAEYVASDGSLFRRFDGHPGPYEDGTWYDASDSPIVQPSLFDAPLGVHRDAASLWAALEVDTTSFAEGSLSNEAAVSAQLFEEVVDQDVTASFANPGDTIEVRIAANDDGCIIEFARRIPGQDWTTYEILEMSPGLVGLEVTDPQDEPR